MSERPPRGGSPSPSDRSRPCARAPSTGLRRASILALTALIAGCGGEEIQQPVPLADEVAIDYPLDLWDRGVEDSTVVRVRVDTAGRVDSALVAEPSGHPAFDSAAVQGARELRFRPGRKDGEPIVVWAEIPVHFSRDSIR